MSKCQLDSHRSPDECHTISQVTNQTPIPIGLLDAQLLAIRIAMAKLHRLRTSFVVSPERPAHFSQQLLQQSISLAFALARHMHYVRMWKLSFVLLCSHIGHCAFHRRDREQQQQQQQIIQFRTHTHTRSHTPTCLFGRFGIELICRFVEQPQISMVHCHLNRPTNAKKNVTLQRRN